MPHYVSADSIPSPRSCSPPTASPCRWGLLSQSPVTTMFGQHIPGMVFGISLIASLIRNRPATELLVEWFRPG